MIIIRTFALKVSINKSSRIYTMNKKSISLVAVMMTIVAVFVAPSLLFTPNQVTAVSAAAASAGDAAVRQAAGGGSGRLQQHQPVERRQLLRAVVVQLQQLQRQTVMMMMTVIKTTIITTTITKTKNGIKDSTISTGTRINNTQFL